MTSRQQWLAPKPWPALQPDNVDIYLLAMPGENGVDEARLDLLNEDEKVRAERLKIPAKRAEFIHVRSQLREILSNTLEMAAQDIRLTQNQHGKPMLADNQAVQFNLAHSGDWAIIAISVDSRVGIDIEQAGRNTEPLALIKRFFSRQEQTALLAMEPADQRRAFFDCWARKEAFVKAEGSGIAYGLGLFSVPVGELVKPAVIRCDKQARYWYLHEINVPQGYHAALVTEHPVKNLRYWSL